VDPLDGTKEFIKRNGEFTVNIALVEDGVPVLGVVHVPVTAITYSGGRGLGAFKEEGGQRSPIRCRERHAPIVMVASRRHGAEQVAALERLIEGQLGPVEKTSMGSSLKLCLVAEGAADIYPRLAPTCEWDTAAAHAVVNAAGGVVVNTHFEPLAYNKPDVLNPHFLVLGQSAEDWRFIEPALA
jgi:3'(2'), 5'-bisphosphate nucleotidase